MSLQLIELFSQLGADGLLVEYEDMFPYEGELKLLQATTHPAYRCSQGNKHKTCCSSVSCCVLLMLKTFLIKKTLNVGRGTKHCSLCSPEEVLSMQEFAKSKGMEIIPLVQTFGHMEVKLKP